MKLYKQHLIELFGSQLNIDTNKFESLNEIMKKGKKSSDLDNAAPAAAGVSLSAISLSHAIPYLGLNPLAVIGAASLALDVIKGSITIYNLYLSKAAKSCKGNEFKMACVLEYKARATEVQIKELIRNQHKCNKSDNPKKCINIINNKIIKLKRKADILRNDAKYNKSYLKIHKKYQAR